MGKIKFTPQMTVSQFEKLFPTDNDCKQYLSARRWSNGVCLSPLRQQKCL